MQALLTVEELSAHIHKSVSSIRSDASRNPQSLPPICRLPGTKRLLWRIEDVEAWIARHVSDAEVTSFASSEQSQKRGRGRPSKADQVEGRQ